MALVAGLMSMFLFMLIILVMYFFMIRPAAEAAKGTSEDAEGSEEG